MADVIDEKELAKRLEEAKLALATIQAARGGQPILFCWTCQTITNRRCYCDFESDEYR